MLTSNETWCDIYSEITFIKVKLIKCNEVIALLRSHNDLS